MEKVSDFVKNKYCYIENAVSKDICEIVTNYTLFDEDNIFSPEDTGSQVPGAHGKYSDLLMESLLLYCLPIMEKNTGLSLSPTYSYYRVYRPGASLLPHTDRESCEISASLFIGYNYEGETWPLYVEDKGYSMNPGDMIVYRGMELNHYRYSFEAPAGSFHSQVFLHYVDNDGPYTSFKYDGRENLGTVKGKNW